MGASLLLRTPKPVVLDGLGVLSFMQPTTRYISVPKGLPAKLVKSTRELKAFAVWYQLKSLRVCGVIKDFSKQAKVIAARFGYSERKLRTYVALLCQWGYIEKPTRHDLVLRASKMAGSAYGVAKSYYRIPSEKLAGLELELRALALRENLERQAYTLKQKLKEKHLRDKGILLSSHLQPAAKRRHLRGFSVSKAQAVATTHFVREAESPTPKRVINPFVTLSRQGIARTLSRRSVATGYRYARKMREAGLLTERPHRIFICDASTQEFGFMRASGYDYSFQLLDGKVYKVLPNLITLSPSLA